MRVRVAVANNWPVGVVHARDDVQALLEEAQVENRVLRDYIMGVGYR